MAPPSLGVVCFRRRDLDEDENASLAAALERSDVGLVSTTRLHGRLAIRLCILNHTSGRRGRRGRCSISSRRLGRGRGEGRGRRATLRAPPDDREQLARPTGGRPAFIAGAAVVRRSRSPTRRLSSASRPRSARRPPGRWSSSSGASAATSTSSSKGRLPSRSTASTRAISGRESSSASLTALDWGAGFALSARSPRCGRPRRCDCSSSRTGASASSCVATRASTREIRAAVAERLPRHA